MQYNTSNNTTQTDFALQLLQWMEVGMIYQCRFEVEMIYPCRFEVDMIYPCRFEVDRIYPCRFEMDRHGYQCKFGVADMIDYRCTGKVDRIDQRMYFEHILHFPWHMKSVEDKQMFGHMFEYRSHHILDCY